MLSRTFAVYIMLDRTMAQLEKSAPPSARLRSLLAKAALVYAVLACLGVGILASFVPNFFEVGELAGARLLVLVGVVLFLVGPVVAVGYFVLEGVFEALVRGVGWILQTCFCALVRFSKKLFRGTEE